MPSLGGGSSLNPHPSPARCLWWGWGGERWSAAAPDLGFVRCLAVLSRSIGESKPRASRELSLSACELNLSQIQRSFEALPGFKRIILIEGSHHVCAWHVLGDTLGISSAHGTFILPLREHSFCHGPDGTWSEENQVIYSSSCFPVWVQSLEHIKAKAGAGSVSSFSQ